MPAAAPTCSQRRGPKAGAGAASHLIKEGEFHDVEALLHLAQLALIKKNQSAAITHLYKAVALESSAACSTLATILLRTAGGLLSPSAPTNMPSYFQPAPPRTSSVTPVGGEEAARLFLRGLTIEMAKPLDSCISWRGGNEEDSDGESAEGTYFSLERTQDLIVGLTTCYRLGVMQRDSTRSTGNEMSSANRGETLARQLLLHPSITDSKLAALVVPTLSPPHSPSLPLTPSLVFALTTPPRKQSVPLPSLLQSSPTRSKTTGSSRPPAFTAQDKRRMAVQVHSLYILALQAWPSQKDVAESYWRYIVDLSVTCGGSIGKEGDGIVAKAQHRLKGEVDDSWKLPKVKRRSNSVTSSAAGSDTSVTSSGRVRSGDALVEMAMERGRLEQKWSSHEQTSPQIKQDDMSTVQAQMEEASTSSITIRTLRKALSHTQLGVSATPRTSYFDSARAIVQAPTHSSDVKAAFRQAQVDYPSPPETPDNSPPGSCNSSGIRTPIVISLDDKPSPPAPELEPRRTLRRVESTASFQPPRILRRVASSASISTVPPDFGRPRVGSSNWQDAGMPTTSSSQIAGMAGRRPLPSRAVSSPLAQQVPAASSLTLKETTALWSNGFRQRLSSIRNPFKRTATAPSASTLLRKVLMQDDASAGPGMFWADETDFEEAQEYSPESPPPPTPTDLHSLPTSRSASPSSSPNRSRNSSRNSSRTRLSHQRSFVDPTTPSSALPLRSHAASAIPLLVTTPPTPQKDHLLPPRPSRRSRKKSVPPPTLYSSSPKALPPMDPFLARLERDSAFGVEAKCYECGKGGMNFSACPRCDGRYCSRECRVKSGGGRHSCVVR
ncbi:hypothetical protein BCR35DRAFT_306514 [Leucosporidium creatinivorum]|uniref:Uncharacterized protein n=1 Tax=Leucosporidium creatinivorum TaxID=106004 RepID=A0A1Y2ET27_9BASI|nr:hypothetical protein BCR35DRAFT_306514 [Leucosporidium creatinivorum]